MCRETFFYEGNVRREHKQCIYQGQRGKRRNDKTGKGVWVLPASITGRNSRSVRYGQIQLPPPQQCMLAIRSIGGYNMQDGGVCCSRFGRSR